MNDDVGLSTLLDELPDWATLETAIDRRLAHGRLPEWRETVASLPQPANPSVAAGRRVVVDGMLTDVARSRLEAGLLRLVPWRKGPFRLCGVDIDTEWRSDWKWARVAPHVGDLTGQRVLDVGAGNGYYGWRMLAAGARIVVGVDPTVLFVMQHRAVNRLARASCHHVVPLALEDLDGTQSTFDTVFSMGVLYHRRKPADHLRQLADRLAPGGRLVLETLVVVDTPTLHPTDRYAGMRNVWCVPHPDRVLAWLAAAGFVDGALVDVCATTVQEQRATRWMPFRSLVDVLDPADPARTIEGLPAPVRAVFTARRRAAD